jgi:hypothetical protein
MKGSSHCPRYYPSVFLEELTKPGPTEYKGWASNTTATSLVHRHALNCSQLLGRFLAEDSVMTTVFWDVTPCNLEDVY